MKQYIKPFIEFRLNTPFYMIALTAPYAGGGGGGGDASIRLDDDFATFQDGGNSENSDEAVTEQTLW